MRNLFILLIFLISPSIWASMLRSDGSTLILKSILENMGQNVLRGVVVDSQGLESRIFLRESDAVELKRGLWVMKAGDYQCEF